MSTDTMRTVRIFRYDPKVGGEGHFDTYQLDIPKPEITTILDVLLRIQKEQDPTISFRFACRVNMCGSCGMVINGCEGLACKTNVSALPPNQDITIRPLNHFPVVKDLVVDMGPFFEKFEDSLPFFEPKEQRDEPYKIRPDDPNRVAIGMSTDCIACGCCVSSCTMVNNHGNYAGPASLTRAFTLLADERDGLFVPRLNRALDSCYHCRTELNCTEVCPKNISGTRAIKFIQRLALKHLKDIKPIAPHPFEEGKPVDAPAPDPAHAKYSYEKTPGSSRRNFLMAAVGVGSVAALSCVLGKAAVSPTTEKTKLQWVDVAKVDDIPVGEIRAFPLLYKRTRAFHEEPVNTTVLIRRDSADDIICYSNTCPHLGCAVSWNPASDRFECACHGGAFDRDGKVIAGPPPRPLTRLPFKVEGGILKVEVA